LVFVDESAEEVTPAHALGCCRCAPAGRPNLHPDLREAMYSTRCVAREMKKRTWRRCRKAVSTVRKSQA